MSEKPISQTPDKELSAPKAVPAQPSANIDTVTHVTIADNPSGNLPVVGPSQPSAGGEILVPGHEILGELGRGGMGIVVKARHLALKRIVALKRIRCGADADPDDLARFRMEAEAAAGLQHPNIVQVYEVGECDGLPYFSLEYVEGGSLDRRLEGKPLPPYQAALLMETLARAMHYAHEHGIVHRDLKPANILLAGPQDAPLEKCTPKITDFGLAKKLDGDLVRTRSGAILGTPRFMSPEQARGRTREIGPASDIWALGAILYELLTGKPAFHAETIIDTLRQVIEQDPPLCNSIHRRVPRDLDTICQKCLRKEAPMRYASAGELADDLRRFLNGEPIRARRVSLFERGWRWARRRPAKLLAALFLVLAVAGSVVGYRLWQKLQEKQAREAVSLELKTSFHAGVLHLEDDPQPGEELSEGEATERPRAFKVYRRNGQIERIDVLGPHGRLVRHNPFHLLATGGDTAISYNRESSYRYTRNEEDRVLEVSAHHETGRILWLLSYEAGQARYRECTNLFTKALEAPTLFEVVRGGDGQKLQEIALLDANGKRKIGPGGAGGLRMQLEAGESRFTLLDAQGVSLSEPGGMASWIVRDAPSGTAVEDRYLDASGNPIAGPEGCPRWEWLSEPDRSLRGSGKDVQGRPTAAKDGAHGCLRRFDERGLQVEKLWCGLSGQPTKTKQGYARVTVLWDAQCQVAETAFWIVDAKGAFALKRRADGRDRTLEEAFFGPDNKPSLNTHGVHRLTIHYNAQGQNTEQNYFGLDGKPSLHAAGNHCWRRRYDERGNEIESNFFGLDGKPVNTTSGYARITTQYDRQGKLAEKGYWIYAKGGFALNRRADASDRTLEQALFTPEGQPKKNKEGYHRWTQRYDEKGNLLEVAVFGTDNKPCLDEDGVHRWTTRYNDQGKQIEQSFFGVDGKPCLRNDGRHGWRGRYDERGNRIEVNYFGLDGKPTNGKPANEEKACARIARQYDGQDKIVEESYWIVDAKGAFLLKRRADAQDRTVEQAVFTPEGKPTKDKEGDHRWTYRYDDKGNVIETAIFGTDNKPCLDKEGVHRWISRYNDQGKKSAQAYFGLDGKPCLDMEGNHRWTARFDDRGNETERSYFGIDGKPTNGKPTNGEPAYARVATRYDGHDKIVEKSYWIVDANSVYALKRRADAQDRTLEQALFTPEGKPIKDKDGDHRWTHRYDDKGQLLEVAFFGSDNKPCLARDGVHRFTTRYNDQGKWIEENYFGVDGKPCLHANGYHRFTWRYNEGGNEIERSYFGIDGKLATSKNGYARLTSSYDAAGALMDQTPHDAAGKPLQFELVVSEVVSGQQGARLGIQEGDVLLRFEGKKLTSDARFSYVRKVGGKEPAAGKLELRRMNKTVTIDVGVGLLRITTVNRVAPDSGKP